MSSAKHKTLIDLLISKTAKGEISWRQTIDEDSYKVDFARHSLKLTYIDTSERGDAECIVTLINEQGQEADSFTDSDLDDHSKPNPSEKYYWFRKMKELFLSARRSALGSDKVLDEIMNELGDDIPF